jgi:hypothetical protein
MNWPGRCSRPANETFEKMRNQVRRNSAEAANTPARTASSDAATTAAAATATTAPATATTTAAATATAAPGHLLEAGVATIFLVEEMEGGEAHVSNFFFAEQHGL